MEGHGGFEKRTAGTSTYVQSRFAIRHVVHFSPGICDPSPAAPSNFDENTSYGADTHIRLEQPYERRKKIKRISSAARKEGRGMKRTLLAATNIAGALKTAFPAPVNFLSIVLVIGGQIVHLRWRKKPKGEVGGEQDLWRKACRRGGLRLRAVHSHATAAAESDRGVRAVRHRGHNGYQMVTRDGRVLSKECKANSYHRVVSLEAMKYSK